MTDISSDTRISGFLTSKGITAAGVFPLAGDASSRRYSRVITKDQRSLILMDTPNPKDDVVTFMAIGDLLRRVSLSAPHTEAVDPDQGLMLLEDFGDETFGRLLANGEAPLPLYKLALDALIALHGRFRPAMAADLILPVYDEDLFVEQVMLFADVAMPVLGRSLKQAERDLLEDAWRAVLPKALNVPNTLLLRDYHVDNLMLLRNRWGEAACGLLDYQNGGIGPISYDIVSLLEDARRDVAPAVTEAALARYLAAFPALDAHAFGESYAVMGAVRHTRILAIFIRLAQQGKRGYLVHMPRVWRLLEAQLEKPALAPVRTWFENFLPEEERYGMAL